MNNTDTTTPETTELGHYIAMFKDPLAAKTRLVTKRYIHFPISKKMAEDMAHTYAHFSKYEFRRLRKIPAKIA